MYVTKNDYTFYTINGNIWLLYCTLDNVDSFDDCFGRVQFARVGRSVDVGCEFL